MKPTRESKLPLEKQLCVLAREFRGTRDERERTAIADKYSDAVKQLIRHKKGWTLIPTLEDQLPDEWMPEEFFEYWKLRPPKRRATRTG